jgi:hypothetical protein
VNMLKLGVKCFGVRAWNEVLKLTFNTLQNCTYYSVSLKFNEKRTPSSSVRNKFNVPKTFKLYLLCINRQMCAHMWLEENISNFLSS